MAVLAQNMSNLGIQHHLSVQNQVIKQLQPCQHAYLELLDMAIILFQCLLSMLWSGVYILPHNVSTHNLGQHSVIHPIHLTSAEALNLV